MTSGTIKSVRGLRILVIARADGDRAELVDLYAQHGALVIEEPDGVAGLRSLYGRRPDLVVLDTDLSGMSGWAVLSRIRELSDVPVLMRGTDNDEADVVRALRMGADDYAAKQPRRAGELLARTEALLRRGGPAADARRTYADSLVEIDFAAAEVRVQGRPLELTPLEFKLLTAFVRNPNRTLGPDELLREVWADDDAPRSRVKLYIRYLREKFAAHEVKLPIETVRGFGYRYRPTLHATTLEGRVDEHLARFEPLFAELDNLRGEQGQMFFPSREAREELAAVLAQSARPTRG